MRFEKVSLPFGGRWHFFWLRPGLGAAGRRRFFGCGQAGCGNFLAAAKRAAALFWLAGAGRIFRYTLCVNPLLAEIPLKKGFGRACIEIREIHLAARSCLIILQYPLFFPFLSGNST